MLLLVQTHHVIVTVIKHPVMQTALIAGLAMDLHVVNVVGHGKVVLQQDQDVFSVLDLMQLVIASHRHAEL